VGITYLRNDDTELEKIQFFGTIIKAEEKKGIIIRKANDNKEFILPPDIESISAAQPGEYRLHSTGDLIVNPDLLSVWTVNKP
jgi:hypothetical protein